MLHPSTFAAIEPPSHPMSLRKGPKSGQGSIVEARQHKEGRYGRTAAHAQPPASARAAAAHGRQGRDVGLLSPDASPPPLRGARRAAFRARPHRPLLPSLPLPGRRVVLPPAVSRSGHVHLTPQPPP